MSGRPVAAAALAALLAAACTDLSFTTAVGGVKEPIPLPSFRRHVAPILSATCASSGACHLGAGAQMGLDLSPDRAHQAIVGVAPQTFRAAAPYHVSPGFPDSSLLFRVIFDTTAAGTYRLGLRRMPLTTYPLPPAVVETIRNWIEQGAPNN